MISLFQICIGSHGGLVFAESQLILNLFSDSLVRTPLSDADTEKPPGGQTMATDQNKAKSKNKKPLVIAYKRSTLRIALEENDIDTVKRLLGSNTCDVNEKEGPFQRSPLHAVAISNQVDILKLLLLINVCDVNARDNDQNTPLIMAVCTNNLDVIKLLLADARCEVNARNNDKMTPVYAAVESHSHEALICY